MADRIRVLHVDDQADFADLVAMFLQRQDDRITVEPVTSAAEGLERLRENSVDCVVSDFDMPRTNGIEFLEAVREQHPELPFVLYTGKGSEEVASEAISKGVTDYLQKSGGTDQYTVLANRIINVVEGARARAEAERMAGHLEQIRAHVTEVVWISDVEKGRIDFVSDAYGEVWGRTPESLKADPLSFVDAVHPDDRERVRAAIQEQVVAPDGYDETYRIVRPDGSVRWVNDRAAGIRSDGELTGIVGVATDITELKEFEQSLLEERAFTESALEVAVDFYWGIDLDGEVIRWSDREGTVTGYPTEEAIGLHTSTFHPDDHFPRIEAAIEEMLETGSTVVEADLLTKTGDRVPYEFAGTVITDDDGEIKSMCGFGRSLP